MVRRLVPREDRSCCLTGLGPTFCNLADLLSGRFVGFKKFCRESSLTDMTLTFEKLYDWIDEYREAKYHPYY
jgi:hypothetical protein